MKQYAINEIFESIQGEGSRCGVLSTFVRFAGCNLSCSGSWSDGVYQPVCDTDFTGVAYRMTANELADDLADRVPRWVVLTGGEPALQVDQSLIMALKNRGLSIAIETNGTKELPTGIDHVVVSPKTADHTIVVRSCDEVRFVIGMSQAAPKTTIHAIHWFLSPAWEPDGTLKRETLEWTLQQIRKDPRWALSIQTHKLLSLR